MKNFALKASVAAAALAFAGAASAAVITTVDLNAGTGSAAYANELAYNDTTPLVGAANALNFKADLGFGISTGQTRYIRLDYGNATLDAPHAAVLGVNLEMTLVADFTGAAVVAGGAVGDSYVIYQITAGADYAATDEVDFAVPALRVTANGSPVSVTMSLHETAVSAVNGANGGGSARLSSVTGNIATFSAGLNFAVTAGANTSSVSTLYKKFCNGATCTSAGSVLYAPLGTVTYGVNAVNKHNGTAVALTDLVTAATNLVVTTNTGSFSDANVAVGGTTLTNGGVWLDGGTDGCGTYDAGVQGAMSSGTVTINVGTTGQAAKNICYLVGGTTDVEVQTVSVALDVTAAAGATTADVTATTLGTIAHDGTTLKVPFVGTKAGQGAWVQLTNTSADNAGYTTTCYNSSGAATNGAAGTITAGRTAQVYAGALCPAGSASAVMTLAVPNGSVIGSFVRQNTTTGDMGLDGVVGNQ